MFPEQTKRMNLQLKGNKSITGTLVNREMLFVSMQEPNYSTARYNICFTKPTQWTDLVGGELSSCVALILLLLDFLLR